MPDACLMTSARVSLARGRGRTRKADPTFSIPAFDRQPRKSSVAILPTCASAPRASPGDARDQPAIAPAERAREDAAASIWRATTRRRSASCVSRPPSVIDWTSFVRVECVGRSDWIGDVAWR